MRLTTCGPNTPDSVIYVHAADCINLRSRPFYWNNPECSTAEYDSVEDLVEEWYCHQIDETGASWREYVDEFRIFPCVVGLPMSAEDAS